ncbi:MAG: hypothetical protein ACUVQY_06385 [Thermoproteota archaeon]
MLEKALGQVDKYFGIAKKEGWRLIYSFLYLPGTPEAKRLLGYLVELNKQHNLKMCSTSKNCRNIFHRR